MLFPMSVCSTALKIAILSIKKEKRTEEAWIKITTTKKRIKWKTVWQCETAEDWARLRIARQRLIKNLHVRPTIDQAMRDDIKVLTNWK